MSRTSIDGLQRRTKTNTAKPKSGKATTTVARRRSLEAPASKKQIKVLVEENNRLDARQAEKEAKAEHEQKIKEFFNEVKDVDPTDLTEIPKKEQKRIRKKEGKKKHKVLRRVILIIVLLLLVGVGFVYFYFDDFVAKITDGGSLLGLLFSDPDTPLQKDSNGRTNILIFGTEGYSMDDPQYDGGFLTDSMMLLSINQDNGDAKAVSLPRDLKSNTCTATSKLNEVYFCEYSKNNGSSASKKEYEKKASQKLADTFNEILGVDVHYRIHANWAAVVKIVNAIGGIDVVFTYGDQVWEGEDTVTPIETGSPKGLGDMNSRYQYAFEYPNMKKVHLDGRQALAVARTRNAYGGYGAENGNFSREYFQQRIIEAIIKTARKKNLTSDLVAVLKIKEAVGDNIRTDFKDTEIKTLLKVAGTINIAKLQTISLYSTDDKPAALLTTGNINGISYVLPTAGVGNYQDIHSYMKRKLSAASYSSENAQIIVLNGTSAQGVASREKEALENRGYAISSIDDAPNGQRNFDGVRIYQKNKKMTKTAEALKKLYGNELARGIQTEIPAELEEFAADFIIVVGAAHTAPTK